MDAREISKYKGQSLFLSLAPLSLKYAIAAQKQPELVVGALLTSYSVFEGFLNYLGRTLSIRIDGEYSTNPNALVLHALGVRLGGLEKDKADFKCKINEIFLKTREQKAPWGDKRFQHLYALASIRNQIAHPKIQSSLHPPIEAGWDQSPEELRKYAIRNWKSNILWKNLVDWGVLPDPTDNKFCRSFSDALINEPNIAIWGHNTAAKIVNEIWECVKHRETGGQPERLALISGLIHRLGVIQDIDIEMYSPEFLVPHWMR